MGYNLEKTKRSIFNKWDWDNPERSIPVFLWGQIGIGKTSIINQVVIARIKKDLEEDKEANKEKLHRLNNYKYLSEVQDMIDEHLLVLRLAERPIEQLQGVPTPDFKNKVTMFFMPENMVNISKAKWVVVFLDELDKADEWKMAAATHLIESKRIGEFTFPKDTYVVCAGNRVEDSWISKEVVPELKNRGAHIDVDVDLGVFLSWAVKNDIRQDMIAFHRYGEALGKNFLAVYTDGENSFATPRTWEFSSRQADKIEKRAIDDGSHSDNLWQEEMFDEIEQLIGKTASEFKAYITLYKKVDIIKILNGSTKIPKFEGAGINKALSNQYVYAMSLCEQITADHLSNEIYLSNFVKALNDFIGDARSIIFIILNSNKKEIIEIISKTEIGAKLIDEFFESMDSSSLQ